MPTDPWPLSCFNRLDSLTRRCRALEQRAEVAADGGAAGELRNVWRILGQVRGALPTAYLPPQRRWIEQHLRHAEELVRALEARAAANARAMRQVGYPAADGDGCTGDLVVTCNVPGATVVCTFPNGGQLALTVPSTGVFVLKDMLGGTLHFVRFHATATGYATTDVNSDDIECGVLNNFYLSLTAVNPCPAMESYPTLTLTDPDYGTFTLTKASSGAVWTSACWETTLTSLNCFGTPLTRTASMAYRYTCPGSLALIAGTGLSGGGYVHRDCAGTGIDPNYLYASTTTIAVAGTTSPPNLSGTMTVGTSNPCNNTNMAYDYYATGSGKTFTITP